MMMKAAVIIFVSLMILVSGGPIAEETFSFDSLKKCYADGGSESVLNCATSRALKILEETSKQPEIQLLPGIIITRNSRAGKDLATPDLPSDHETRPLKLFDLLLQATSNFISGRSLKIEIPETGNLARAFEEGRGKMKKMMGPLMLGLGAKMITVIPIMLGGLALLASKALLIGKIAFVISLIIFANYFFTGRNIIPPYGFNSYGSSYGGGYGSYGGTNSLGGWTNVSPQYGAPYAPYARSIGEVTGNENESKTAQNLAYSSHKR